jgi:hypothetical protein
MQRDWLPLALIDGDIVLRGLKSYVAYEVVHCPARSSPVRIMRAETTHRLPGYRFGWGLPGSRCEASTADFIAAGPMDSGVVPRSACNGPVSVLVPVMNANAAAIRYTFR